MNRKSGYAWLLVGLLLVTTRVSEAAMAPGEIPPGLEAWAPWVLHGQSEALCPTDYDDGTVARCQWPSRLNLEISSDQGTFEQRWLMFAEGWAVLPGSADVWPDSVTVDGQTVAVIHRNNAPMIRLSPGDHRIMGRFTWQQRPEMIQVPPELGLLELSIDGRRVRTTAIDAQGRLWLQEGPSTGGREERIALRLFRLLDDTIPMQVTTHLRLDVSGNPREIELAGVLLENSIPMAIKSPLPARLDANGRLTVQARAGRWEISIVARISGPQFKINAGPCPYGDEVWSFQPRHALRMVEVLDVAPVEPGQTDMPDAWRGYPAYLLKSGGAMTLKEIRRGDPDPAPDQLTLHRTWWLDFDGTGFTVRDVIGGTLSRQWSLAVNAPLVLGRVAVDGEERVITEQGPEKKMGVELRRGHLALEADSRVPDRPAAMAAVGWEHDFQAVAGVLHLPPGWRIFSASGVDWLSDTWLKRWSLLDLFLLLIIALAVARLRAWYWGIVTLVTMMLIWHETGAPRWVWLHLLAVLALWPLLPAGWLRRIVTTWGIGAVAVLLITAIPFVVQQIRWGLYPQLAPHAERPVPARTQLSTLAPPAPMVERMDESDVSSRMMTKAGRAQMPSAAISVPVKDADLIVHDPDALIPTGPGLPDWQWRSVQLRWSGPVSKAQDIRFYLLSPVVNFILAMLRVALLIVLMWILFDWRSWWRPWWQRIRDRLNPAAVVVGVVLCLGMLRPEAYAADASAFPPPALLDELRQRLLEKPDCLPHCAEIARMEVVASGDDLQVMLKIHCADRMAVPLPVNRKSWLPDQILLDNAPISGLRVDDQGQMWALVPSGVHTLILTADVGTASVVQMPLPLRPHNASYAAAGWRLDGIDPNGNTGSSIQLTRLKRDRSPSTERPADSLPPFLKVERLLRLGLTWQATTTVTRLTPTGAPIVVTLPLMADESVTTSGVQVDQGQALINMAPSERMVTFDSVLSITPMIELTAPKAVPWTETWILDAAAIWHCEMEGIAAVHHQDGAGQWQPRWQPWPGEKIMIRVHRPAAVSGQIKTIDGADLVLTPGQRFGQGELHLRMRTSRGGQHTIELPSQANLQQVTVNGKTLPVRQDGPYVTVPLQPGAQAVAVRWQQLSSFGTFFKVPELKLGQPAVNARVTVNVPAQRWILMVGGPRWGPAVLFWSYLIAIALAALVLARLPLTPLRNWQWLLLGLGLTQVPPAMALIIVGWLLALGLRARAPLPQHWLLFNAIQIGLVIWTLAALAALFAAVKAGLLGQPEMQIAGNQSSHMVLKWTQDHIAGNMPQPWLISLPVWLFNLLMLVWSLWLAWTLLGWLKWGWHSWVKDGGWRKVSLRRSAGASPH